MANKKLYVGNLSYEVDADTLREIFSPYGEVVSVQVITDKETGRSKGFGFVAMGDEASAEAAIAGLNGTSVSGRDLTVNEARPQEDRGNRSGGGGGRGGFGGGGGRGGRGGYGGGY